MKILLLEDNQKLNETITKRLKMKNYTVISFTDGAEIKIEKLCQIKNDKIYFDENSYFDFISATITINDQEIRLTKKEKLLMNLFLSKKNQVITYETIENYVWEGNFVTLESIRSLIRRLRKILDKEFIQTVIDTGYIFKNI